MEVKEGIRLFMENVELRGLSPNTKRSYRDLLCQFQSWCDGHGVQDIGTLTALQVNDFLTSLGSIMSKRSVNQKKQVLSSFLTYMEDISAIDRKPKMPKITYDKKLPDFLDEAQVRLAEAGCKTKFDRALFRFMVSTGMREAEVCNLKKVDVNWNTGKITVRNAKNNKDEYVFINKTILDMLADLSSSKTSEYVFQSANGRICTKTVYLTISKIGERVGIKLYPHMLRHTFCTLFYNRSKDLKLTQRAMRHSSVTITEIYTHLVDGQLQEQSDKFIESIDFGGDDIVSSK